MKPKATIMKTSILSSLFAICCICSLILSSGSYITIQAQTWPQFRGINSSGIADQDANPPVELSEENLQWKIETPIGHSSPVIWGDKIFISGCREDEKKLFDIV